MNNTQHSKQHRHMVIAPVFLLLVLASFTGARVPVAASVTEDQSHMTTVHVGTSMVYSAPKELRLYAGEAELVLFSGSAHVHFTDEALTISALTSPVAVAIQGSRIVVPTSMQWTYNRNTDIADLSDDFSAWHADRSATPLPPSFIERSLAGAEAPEDMTFQIAEITELMQEDLLYLVLSLHPTLKHQAWVSSTSIFSQETELVRMFFYLDTLMTEQVFSVFTFDRYAMFVEDRLSSHKDTTAFIENMLAAYVPLVTDLHMHGLPKRARALSAYLAGLTTSVLEQTEYMTTALAALSTMALPSAEEIAEEQPEPLVVEEEVSIDSMLPEEAQRRVHALLQNAGALYTVHTTVSAVGRNIVEVRDIAFGGSAGDRMVSFDIDAQTYAVSNIIMDDMGDFPYSPVFEAFVAWFTQ